MARHSQLLSEMLTSIKQISDRLPPAASPTPVPHIQVPVAVNPLAEPRLPPPQRFSGYPSAFKGFFIQCFPSFELQPLSFPTDRSKIAYIITLLSHKALAWATAVRDAQSPCCPSYSVFAEKFKRVFQGPTSGPNSAKQLLTLRQGRRSMTDYAIQFSTVEAASGWNEALTVCFLKGLSDTIQDELATREPSRVPDQVGQAYRPAPERERNHRPLALAPIGPRFDSPPSSLFAPPEPMQIGRISQAERERRMREGYCLCCRKSGQFSSACPGLQGNATSCAGLGNYNRIFNLLPSIQLPSAHPSHPFLGKPRAAPSSLDGLWSHRKLHAHHLGK